MKRWLLALFLCHALTAHAAPPPLTSDQVVLTDADGRTVQGIVCDNLRGMKGQNADQEAVKKSREDYLILSIAGFETAQFAGQAWRQNAQGQLVADEAAGAIVGGRGRLFYCPPDEFNLVQQPQEEGRDSGDDCLFPTEPRRKTPRADSQITAGATREITVTMTVTPPGGAPLAASRTILLARPTVVLVHGINTRAESWDGKHGEGLRPALLRLGYTVVAFEHGLDDLKDSQQPGRGGVYFEGNGPVEWHAARLGRTIENALAGRRSDGFATRRVDVVARSYGGVIARWYLRTGFGDGAGREQSAQSRQWYVNSANVPGGADLYWMPDWFMKDAWPEATPSGAVNVRKLITVTSMWRGVPLCNYLNEIYSADAPDSVAGTRLGDAPVRGLHKLPLLGSKLGTLRGIVENAVSRFVPTRSPAIEVMAINSRWLRFLLDKPFLDEVAYASVAGADNHYPLKGFLVDRIRFDAYTTLDFGQHPSWFPYFELERRHIADNERDAANLSDGIVPVWSALLPGGSNAADFDGNRVVPPGKGEPANHADIISNDTVIAYVERALNHNGLPTGKDLAAHRDDSVWTPCRKHVWHFTAGDMAPISHAGLYVLQGGVARLNVAALREADDATHSAPRRAADGRYAVEITWHTVKPECGRVKVFRRWNEPSTGQPNFIKVAAVDEERGPEVCCCGQEAPLEEVPPTATPPAAPLPRFRHQATVTGLKPGEYYYLVEAEFGHRVDDNIFLSSDREFVSPGFAHKFTVPK